MSSSSIQLNDIVVAGDDLKHSQQPALPLQNHQNSQNHDFGKSSQESSFKYYLELSKIRVVNLRSVILACVATFIVSIVLGIVIGRFGIQNTPDLPSDPGNLKNTGCPASSTASDMLSTLSRVSVFTAETNSHESSCECSYVSKSVSPTATEIPSSVYISQSPIEISSPSAFKSTQASSVLDTASTHPMTQTATITESTILATTVTITECTIRPTTSSSLVSSTPSSVLHDMNTTSDTCRVCPTRNPNISTKASPHVSPFMPLTDEEIRNVVNVMKSRGYSTWTQEFHDNRISHVYLYRPPKTDVMNFLDNNGESPLRYARVHVIRPSAFPPDVMEFKVGPVNETNNILEVKQLLVNGTIHINRKPFDSQEVRHMNKFISNQLESIDGLLQESFDGASFVNNTISPQFSLLPTDDISDRVSHVVLTLDMGGDSSLRLLPVSCKLHHPGTDKTAWFAEEWFYLSQGPFNSSIELQDLFDKGDLRKVIFPKGYRETHNNELNLERNVSLPERDFSSIPPPKTYETEGPRYTIQDQHISWMSWKFYFSSDPVRGPGVFDVRFLSTRIAYEISLQDITLIYHSQTNGHGPLVLSDISYLLGWYTSPRLGLDCPSRSNILNTTTSFEGYPTTIDAACVFEADGQRTLWRHESRGLVDNFLVLRTILTIGNYDYTVEWNFHLNGRIETQISASGYLYGAFWDMNDPYVAEDKSSTHFGYRLSDYLTGPIHDHTYSFKVDLDILGTNNSFQSINWKAGESQKVFMLQSNIIEKANYFYFNTTRYVEREIVEHESKFTLDPLNPKYWTVVNEQEQNIWGVTRGYRIIPHSKFAEILQDHPVVNSWDHLKYHVAVSKRKDDEQYATDSLYYLSHSNNNLIVNRVELDSENIRNEDLVVWISEKFLHLPSSEDVPMTMSVQSGFTLKPFNYFDRTPTFDIPAHYSDTDNPYEFEPCYEHK